MPKHAAGKKSPGLISKPPRAGQTAPRGRAPGKVAAHAKALVAGDCCADCAGKSILAPKDRRVLRHLRTLGSAHAKGALKSGVVARAARSAGSGGKTKRGGRGESETSVRSGADFYTSLGLGEFADDVRGLEGLGSQEVFDVDAEDFDDSGLDGLGELSPDDWFPSKADVDQADATLDRLVNAFLADVDAVSNLVPSTFMQQVDDFVSRWRKIHDTWYALEHTRANQIINMQAEFNRLRSQFLSYGVGSTSAGAATVKVDGQDVDADKYKPKPGPLDRFENLIMWVGIIAGSAAAIKISSDLGVFKKLGGLVPGHAR